jgi:protein-S-isoprenylcysteine O-methyltransferase Ste14
MRSATCLKTMSGKPWWKGVRGEWYVVAQFALFALVAIGPRSWDAVRLPGTRAGYVTGVALLLTGLALSTAGALWLGRNLTPLPHPKNEGTSVEKGPFRVVRHPIYSGIVITAFGWALVVRGPLTLVYALALFLFFDVKSIREERWLSRRFAGYAAYQKRVRKLIPFVY